MSTVATACDNQRINNSERDTGTTSSPDSLIKQGTDALYRQDYPTARALATRLIELVEQQGLSDPRYEIHGNIILGQASIMSDKPQNAYACLRKAEGMCIRENDDNGLASVYNGMGILSTNIEHDYQGALKYFFKGIDAAKRAGNKRMNSLLMANVALMYYIRKDPAGLRYARECYDHGHRTSDDYLSYFGAIVMTYYYLLEDKGDLALKYVREAEYIHNTRNLSDYGNLYNTYGKVLYSQGDLIGAKDCFDRVIANRSDYDSDKAMAYASLSDICSDSDRHGQALALLDSALNNTVEGILYISRPEILEKMAKIQRSLGHKEKAATLKLQADRERENLNNAINAGTIEELRAKYDLERAENDISRKQIELIEKQNELNILFAAVIIILIVLTSTALMYKRKNRLYRAIVAQTTEAAREETALRETIRHLEERIAASSRQPDNESEHKSEETNITPHTQPVTTERHRDLAARFDALLLDPAVYTDNLISKDKIARLLDTNRTYISKLVNERYGMTFTQYINSLRIKEAVRRLSDPTDDTSLKDLADILGFNSMTTFYSRFNEYTGMTPAVFRAQSSKCK